MLAISSALAGCRNSQLFLLVLSPSLGYPGHICPTLGLCARRSPHLRPRARPGPDRAVQHTAHLSVRPPGRQAIQKDVSAGSSYLEPYCTLLQKFHRSRPRKRGFTAWGGSPLPKPHPQSARGQRGQSSEVDGGRHCPKTAVVVAIVREAPAAEGAADVPRSIAERAPTQHPAHMLPCLQVLPPISGIIGVTAQ
jgi:hypothetical protein